MSILKGNAPALEASWRYLFEYHQLSVFLGFIIVIFLLLYLRGLYRIYLHPLSGFPGPEEAARSDSWLYRQINGGFPEDIFEQLHKEYNTKALRIAPNELHITDTSLYKTIYRQSKPFPKHEPFYLGFMAKEPTVFTEVDADKHKERRRILNPFFSRSGVVQLEPLIGDKLQEIQRKIDRLCQTKAINMSDALRLLTTTIIMEFLFCSTGGMMDEDPEGFGSKFLNAFVFASHGVSTFQHFPLARHLANAMPASWTKALSPESGGILDLSEFAANSVSNWRHLGEAKRKEKKHPIVLDHLAHLSDHATVSEALDLIVAGSDTTACSLTVAFLEILSNPSIEARLVAELDAAMPQKDNLVSLRELEQLRYLSACVKESLRFASPVPSRLPRVVPQDEREQFVVDGRIVPPGTIISMSIHTMHNSFDIWGPDARIFNPDRWLAPDAKNLEQYLSVFSKGLRMCIGQNLVPVEMTMILASLFRRYKFSFPKDFVPPKRVDVFTVEMKGGLGLNVVPR